LRFFSSTGVRLSAQNTFGRISGTIVDPSGASIPGAKVTVRNTDTQATRVVTTDNSGFYVAENLPIGPYAVELNQPGFKRASRSGFQLIADGRITANFTLEIGEASQSVDVVETNTEQLNTVSGELAHVVDTAQVDNLALNGRNYMELLTLVPGVMPKSSGRIWGCNEKFGYVVDPPAEARDRPLQERCITYGSPSLAC
jgi:hypothetical protein